MYITKQIKINGHHRTFRTLSFSTLYDIALEDATKHYSVDCPTKIQYLFYCMNCKWYSKIFNIIDIAIVYLPDCVNGYTFPCEKCKHHARIGYVVNQKRGGSNKWYAEFYKFATEFLSNVPPLTYYSVEILKKQDEDDKLTTTIESKMDNLSLEIDKD